MPTPAPTRKLADLTGPGITTRFGMEGTDLGITTTTPSGRVIAVFGDTFAGAGVGAPHVGRPNPGMDASPRTTTDPVGPGNPDWRSPVALYADVDPETDRLEWTGAAGPGPDDYAAQLLDYVHGEGCSTKLPSDVITLSGSMYLHVMVNEGLGNVVRTEIHVSHDDGHTWQPTGAEFSPRLEGGFRQLWTWADGGDGFVYVFSTGFQRDKGAILGRVPVEQLVEADGRAWQTYGFADGTWDWGHQSTIMLPGAVGELYLRRCEDFWTLTYFNAGEYRIDCLAFRRLGDDLTDPTVTSRTVLLEGGAWGQESDGSQSPARVAQLYGGCPLPGATADRFPFVVSQWNTDDSAAGPAGWPYRSMLFTGSIARPPAAS